jgi:uncharacterized protein (TIGR02147 family)
LITLEPRTLIAKPDLFQYLEYRAFLSDYVEWKLQVNPSFSRRAFSQKYFGSTGILYSVIGGDRDLGPKLRVRCAAALGLSEKENEYFELLVQHNQAKTDMERNFLFNLLSKFHNSKAWVVRENQHKYYTKWYYAVVFNYLGLDHKKGRPVEIAADINPPLSVEQVEDAIQLLLDLELIRKGDNGYVLTRNHLMSGEGFRGDVALEYNRQIHGLSDDMVKGGFRRCKAFNTQVMTVSDTTLKAIRDKYADFQAEIQDLVAKDKATDKVCTMIFQIVPNTQ